jgi:hypothetical protein
MRIRPDPDPQHCFYIGEDTKLKTVTKSGIFKVQALTQALKPMSCKKSRLLKTSDSDPSFQILSLLWRWHPVNAKV